MLIPAVSGTALAQGAARGYRGRTEQTQSSPSSSGVMQAVGLDSETDGGIQLTAKRSFFDRLFGGDGKKTPSGPPQDPGMTYPKASQQRRVNPEAATIPSVAPPVTANNGVRTPSVQLPPASDLNTQMPPGAPPATLSADIDAQPAISLTPASPQEFVAPANPVHQPKAMPQLKEMLGVNKNGQSASKPVLPPAVDLSISASSTSGLPPATDLTVKPTEIMPLDPATISTAEPEVDIPQFAEIQPEAEPADDPFADLFPEDEGKQPAADPEFQQPVVKIETPEQSAEPSQPMQQREVAVETVEPEKPYTGLTLEEDLFESTPTTAEAAPEMPAPPVASTASRSELTLPPVGASAEPTVTVEVQPAPAPMVEAQPKPEQMPLKVASLPKAEVALEPQLPPVEQPQAAEEQAPVEKKATVVQKPSNPEHDSKLQKIAAREGLTGLKGFCPVTLRDHRDLVDSHEDHSAIFNGKRYQFATEDALEAFLDDPVKYAPATRGSDVIHLALTGEEKEGTLDYAVWYRGRLYLFASPETMETFVAAPSSHATND